MNTITLPKIEYLNMHKTQKELKQRLNLVEKALIDFTKDEVSSAYAIKLNKISVGMDKGKGLAQCVEKLSPHSHRVFRVDLRDNKNRNQIFGF